MKLLAEQNTFFKFKKIKRKKVVKSKLLNTVSTYIF